MCVVSQSSQPRSVQPVLHRRNGALECAEGKRGTQGPMQLVTGPRPEPKQSGGGPPLGLSRGVRRTLPPTGRRRGSTASGRADVGNVAPPFLPPQRGRLSSWGCGGRTGLAWSETAGPSLLSPTAGYWGVWDWGLASGASYRAFLCLWRISLRCSPRGEF